MSWLRTLISRFWAFLIRMVLLVSCGVATYALTSVGVAYSPVGCLILAALAWKRLRRWQGSGWAYGTARIGNMLDACRAGWLTSKDGLVIGRASYCEPPSRWQALRLMASPFVPSREAVRLLFAAWFRRGDNGIIRIKTFVHAAVFAPTGLGKGVSIIIPILKSYFGSCVITDPKCENYLLTAEHRRKHGHKIILLDPFGIGKAGSDSLNPLDLIDDSAPDFQEQVADLADALIVVTGNEREPHFPESAKIVLGCIIAYVCACSNPPDRNLQSVRYILKSRHRFNNAIVAMQAVTTHGGLIAGMGHLLTWYVEKELGSVQTTITRFTAWLDSEAMQAITTLSSFDPRELQQGKATLYLVLPPERLQTLAPLMRMWVSTILRALTRGAPNDRRQVLFLLDEAGHLGRMQILESAVTIMRGYGIRLFFFFQSVDQVAECFGERATRFLDNMGLQIYFGTNAYESAEQISKRCGDTTILIESLNRTKSYSRPSGGVKQDQSGSVSTGESVTISEMGRPLFRPDELLRLRDDLALLFYRNMPVMPIRLLRYYDAKEFKNGRSGASRGLGLWAGVVASVVLLCSLALAAFTASLPRPPSRQPFPRSYPAGGEFGPSAGHFPEGVEGDGPWMQPVEPWRQPPPFQPGFYPPAYRRPPYPYGGMGDRPEGFPRHRPYR